MFFLQFSFSNILLFRRLRCREKIRLFWNIKFTWGTFYYFIYTYYNIKYTTVLFMRFSYYIDFPSDQHFSSTKQPWPETFQFVQLSHLQTFLAFKAFLIQSSVSSIFHFIAFWQNLFSSKWFPRFLCLLNCVVLPTLILILLAPQSFYNGLSYPCAMFSSETRP